MSVAILISGQLGQISEKNLDAFCKHFLVPNPSADVFMVSDGKMNTEMVSKAMGTRLKSAIECHAKEMDAEVEKMKHIYAANLGTYPCNSNTMYVNRWNKKYTIHQNLIRQQLTMQKCLNSMEEYERKHNMTYDMIARVRIDRLTYLDPIVMSKTHDKMISCHFWHGNAINGGPYHERWWTYDFLFFGTRNEVKEVIDKLTLDMGKYRLPTHIHNGLIKHGQADHNFIAECQTALAIDDVLKKRNANHVPFPPTSYRWGQRSEYLFSVKGMPE